MPKPQQCRIRGTSPTYTTTHSNARSLTHQVRPIVEPTTSWFLVGFVNHCATMGTKTYAFFYSPADLGYIFHLSATLLLSLMPVHSGDCILSIASHSDLFSSWNFFLPHHFCVVCLPNRLWGHTLLHYLTGDSSVMWCSAPLSGSVCESIPQVFFFIQSWSPTQHLWMFLLESLDSKYVLLNKWRMEAMNGMYLFWNCRVCIHEGTSVKHRFSWCHVTQNQTD